MDISYDCDVVDVIMMLCHCNAVSLMLQCLVTVML